jgi:uncharacterized protein
MIRNVKGTPSFSKIIENICVLCEVMPHVEIHLRVNYDEKSFANGNITEVFEQIPSQYRNNIIPIYQRVWQTYVNKKDKTEELTTLHQSNMALGYKRSSLTSAFNLFPGIKCYADSYYFAAVNYDGKVYKCTGKDYGELQVTGQIHENGRLVWDEALISKMYARPNFDNEKCLECKHLPICIGACHQNKSQQQCALDGEIGPEAFILDTHDKRIREGKEMVKK